MTSDAHIKSGSQAVLDISNAMLKAAGECLKLHGDDPNTPAILSAAFTMSVDTVTKLDPTFKARLLAQLSPI